MVYIDPIHQRAINLHLGTRALASNSTVFPSPFTIWFNHLVYGKFRQPLANVHHLDVVLDEGHMGAALAVAGAPCSRSLPTIRRRSDRGRTLLASFRLEFLIQIQ